MKRTQVWPNTKIRPEQSINNLREAMSWTGHGDRMVDFVLNEDYQDFAWGNPVKLSRFELWPGSLGKHHAWPHGLLIHTTEVCEFSRLLALGCKKTRKIDINLTAVLAAALFHDLGKMYDYEMAPDINLDEEVCWQQSDHFKKVHHLVKSYDLWKMASKKLGLGDIEDQVSHCILAHHGELAYGSPVKPDSQEAWIVHLADMASVNTVETRWKNI